MSLYRASFAALSVILGCGGEAFSSASNDDSGPRSADAANPPDVSSGADQAAPPPLEPPDAPGVAADAATTPPTSGCALHPFVTFCEDFDGVTSMAGLVAKWSGTIGGGGVLNLVQGPDVPSPPNALGATAGSNDGIALAHPPFGAAPASIHLEYALRVDANKVGGLDAAPLVTLVMGTDPSVDGTVFFYLGNTDLALGWSVPADAGRGFHYYAFQGSAPVGVWSGRWALDISTADGTLRVSHDSVLVGTASEPLPASMRSPAVVTLLAGLPHNTAFTGTVGVTIDDLVLDEK